MRTGLIVLGASVVSFTAGFASSYFVISKRLEAKYNDIAEQEIADAKQFYRVLKQKEFETPEAAVKKLIGGDMEVGLMEDAADALLVYQGKRESASDSEEEEGGGEQEEAPAVYHKQVPRTGEGAFEASTEHIPQIKHISEEEALHFSEDVEVSTLTYYVEDKVLTDSQDKPVDEDDLVMAIGSRDILQFGKLPGDTNVVYIHNERLGSVLEICKSAGSYAREVLGVEPSEEV